MRDSTACTIHNDVTTAVAAAPRSCCQLCHPLHTHHTATLAEVHKLVGLVGQLELLLERFVLGHTLDQLVEDVEGALTLQLVHLQSTRQPGHEQSTPRQANTILPLGPQHAGAVKAPTTAYHSALLQQICADARTTDVVGLVEVDLNQLAKATAVVVAQGLGIAKRLQDGVGLPGKGRSTSNNKTQACQGVCKFSNHTLLHVATSKCNAS